MHIVFLHGYGQSADLIRKKRCNKIIKKLVDIQIHVIDAPFSSNDIENGCKNPRCWWTFNGDVNSTYSELNHSLGEMEESLKFVYEYCKKLSGPIYLFGFSQGACLASMLINDHPEIFVKAIIVASFPIHRKFEPQNNPVFLVHGSGDQGITKRQLAKLQKRYNGEPHQHWIHAKGHVIPQTSEAIDKYLQFLELN